jgi:tetratricopeptide (TPR) repeat protein
MAKKQQPKPVARPVQQPKPAAKPQAAQIDKPKKKLALKWQLALILGVIAFVLYANTLNNEYVLDDNMVIAKNTIVTKGVAGIPEILTTPRLKGYGYFQNENYRPLSLVMFAIEWEVMGESPATGHFFNVLFFALGAIMLFFFLDKLFDRQRTGLAFIAALLFALHPIHTEVVANIKSRDEVMCFFFGFWSLNVFIDYMKQGKAWQLVAGVVLYFLAFVSKETVIAFLFVIPMLFFFYQNEHRKRAITITACAVVIAAIYTTLRITILKANNTYNTLAIDFIDNALAGAPDFLTQKATAIYILGMYLKLMFWPAPLICDYCYNSIPFKSFGNIWVLLSTVIYLALVVVGFYRLIKFKKDPWAFAILFYLSTLFLFSNLPFLIGAAAGERFMFFASIGFCLALALAIEKWLLKREITYRSVLDNKLVAGVLVVICIAFSVLTFARNNEWESNYTLFKADVAKADNDARLYFYYGDELAEGMYPNEKDTAKQRAYLQESIVNLKKAIEIYPKYTEAHVEAGKAYFMGNNYDSAEYHFKRALELTPDQAIAANNLGTIYLRTNRIREAANMYARAVKTKGDFSQAYFNLGSAYLQLKMWDSALYAFSGDLQFNPNDAAAYMQMGLVYYMQNQWDKALPYFNKSVEMDPNNVDGWNNMGAAYLNSGKVAEALEMFKKTVAINPNYTRGYSNMGHCYYQLKQYPQTIEVLTKVIQMDPNSVNDIPYIALSYKALGRMQEAKQYEAMAQRYYPTFNLQSN